MVLLIFGVLILSFISGAAAVTQDVIHPGLRATSYAIAVVVQNLLGASTAPIIMGKIYDLTNIQTALSVLPLVLLVGAILFWMGSRHYSKDLEQSCKGRTSSELTRRVFICPWRLYKKQTPSENPLTSESGYESRIARALSLYWFIFSSAYSIPPFSATKLITSFISALVFFLCLHNTKDLPFSVSR